MKQFKVGILGATGAVGREMMKILEERKFPVAELRPIASERSAGTKLPFNGGEVEVVAADSAFEGLDLVLGAAENDIAKQYAPAIVKAGAVFVDNSSAFRLDKDVPLVIPEINPEDEPAESHREHRGLQLSGSQRRRRRRPHRADGRGGRAEQGRKLPAQGVPVSDCL